MITRFTVFVFVVTLTLAGMSYIVHTQPDPTHTFTVNSFQIANETCSYLQIQYDASADTPQAVQKIKLDIPCLKSMWPDAEVEIVR